MSVNRLFSRHERYFEENRFVYPVLSRRSGGISIGINLNPDKVCNFNCAYCQVRRVSTKETRFVDTARMLQELERTIDLVTSGDLYSGDRFRDTPQSFRQLTNIAFSGDGEPTLHRNFPEIVEAVADVKRKRNLPRIPLVLITNASTFHREKVQEGLDILDQNNGEIWAKLDAGTSRYYQRVNRAPVPFETVLSNISHAARQRPLVIQSLFMRIHGEGPPESERRAYCDRLKEIIAAGGQLKWIQIYTVARPPAESYVSPMSDEEVDRLADFVRENTGLPVSGFHGADTLLT
ncbi:MAG: radical SAM protein [Planctomycetota bacterium]